MRRRGVAVLASCRLWINHWEIHPSIQFHFLYDPTTLEDASSAEPPATIPGWAASSFYIFSAFFLSPATATATAARQTSVFFSASSAPLSADVYSSTLPVYIPTCLCWFAAGFPIPIRPPLVSVLCCSSLHSLSLSPFVGTPLPAPCLVPPSPKKPPRPSHLSLTESLTVITSTVQQESSRGLNRLPCLIHASLSFRFMESLTCFDFEATCFF